MKELQQVPIEKIVADDDFNTRERGVGDVKSLSKSIESIGVLEPLLGKTMDDGTVRLHAGFRRLAAAKLANLDTVPVMVVPRRRITAKQCLLENITENVHSENETAKS